MKKRYISEPTRFYDISDSYFVKCPACQEMAVIRLPSFLEAKKAVAQCLSCQWRIRYDERITYVPALRSNCASCGNTMALPRIELPKPNPHSYVNCSHCQFQNKVTRWDKKLKSYTHEGKADPIFGLTLFFQTPIGNDLFWVINARHLDEILSYVSSHLRERTTTRFNMTMVEKLPKFIIRAHNRDKITSILTFWKKEIMLKQIP
jgi:Zn ribbon nucleic-acid-binding protein